MHGALGKIGDWVGTAWHAITGTPSEDEKRNQRYLVNNQIKAYKEQTDLAMKEIQEKQAERQAEKRKVNEKQIRALRGSYRPPGGFLNNQAPSLGTSGGLSNKLGT